MSPSFFRSVKYGNAGVVSALLLFLTVASTAVAAPPSLRSEADMNDVVDSFMRDITSGQVASAYRGLIRYSTSAMRDPGEVISETAQRRRELRTTIGLSIGFDPVGVEYASERVARVTRLERFDDGALVWRFLFYRADAAWQVVDVAFNGDLGVLFGEPWSVVPAWPEAVNPSEGEIRGEETPRSAPASEYEIDIDGRLEQGAS